MNQPHSDFHPRVLNLVPLDLDAGQYKKDMWLHSLLNHTYDAAARILVLKWVLDVAQVNGIVITLIITA